MRSLPVACLVGLLPAFLSAASPEGTSRVQVLNYANCIQLENETTRVVLGHHRGGRVLVYAHRGKNALYLDPAEGNWKPGTQERIPVSAGRFDIGPEKIIPSRRPLWEGPWTPEIIGPRKARLISPYHEGTGVQLIREFSLAASGTHLACKQIIRNISSKTTEWCHWSRTFAQGQGICVIPLSPTSRFPQHYVMYEPRNLINISPQQPSIRQRDGFLEILRAPPIPQARHGFHAGLVCLSDEE